MRDRIAVGISDPATSAEALTWAMHEAAKTGAEVVLVHVLHEAAASVETTAGDRMLAAELRTARMLSPESSVQVRSLAGSVMWQLVAASDDYDLIVIGTHKSGFIHGSVYGSASLSLAATAACPVIVVPAVATADPSGVVVGADGSVAGIAALAFAVAQAANAQQLLTVVRVSPPAPASARRGDDLPDPAADRLLSRLRALALASHPGAAVRTRNIMGSPAETLVAASAGSRLLVLGDSRTGSSAPPALGVVCHDALLNIRVPTAIVHSADSASADPAMQRAAWLRSVRAARAGGADPESVPPTESVPAARV